MTPPENFEVLEGYCCYRLTGHGPAAEAASKVIEILLPHSLAVGRPRISMHSLSSFPNSTGRVRPQYGF